MLLQSSAHEVQPTKRTTVDVATHVLQLKHGRGTKGVRQKDKSHKGYLNMLNRGCNEVIEGHDM